MSLTNDQLQERIETIEDTLNDMQDAVNNLATKAQLKQLTNIWQSEITDLQDRVTALESQVATLQASL